MSDWPPAPDSPAFAPMTWAELLDWIEPRLRRIAAEELALVRQRVTILEQRGGDDADR